MVLIQFGSGRTVLICVPAVVRDGFLGRGGFFLFALLVEDLDPDGSAARRVVEFLARVFDRPEPRGHLGRIER